jgi:hypothetical protein
LSISRGLAALIFIIFFQTTLVAEYLYKDDVVNKLEFTENVEKLGAELYEKTGISLKLVMIRDLPFETDIQTYQEQIIKESDKPTILLTFAELNSLIDIHVSDPSLYKHFDKKQVLSPVASTAQAIVMAVLFAESFENFFELAGNSGGTILPLLGSKAKDGEITGKYAAAMFNGYVDIARQIADKQDVELSVGDGKSSKYVLTTIKVLFYGVILMAIVMYIRKKLYERRMKRGDN